MYFCLILFSDKVSMFSNKSAMYNTEKYNLSSKVYSIVFGATNGSDISDLSGAQLDFYFNAGYLSENFQDEIHLDLSPLSVSLIVLYSIVFLAGLIGNIFVVIVIIKFKSMRTLTNVFLVNLTVGDILVIVICVPLTLGGTVYRKWIYGSVMCKLTPFIQGAAIGVSVLSLLAISVSRYFAIHKPLTAKIVFSKKNVKILLMFIWIVSLASFSPLLYVTSVTKYGVPGIFENTVCEEKWESIEDKNIYNVFIFAILFFCPFVFMGVAYIVIGYTLWHGNAVLFNNNSTVGNYKKTNLILRQRRRTVKMLICVVTIFGICWLPYYCINLWIDFNMAHRTSTDMYFINTYVYPLVLLLGLGNSAMNPICYYFLSHGFKRGFNKIFCFGLLRRRGSFILSSFRIKYSTGSESLETADI